MAQQPYIDMERFDGEHYIFTGRNALRHAIYYAYKGQLCTNDSLLYNLHVTGDGVVVRCMEWNKADGNQTAFPVMRDNLVGNGCHAKVYELANGVVIFSSQNNGNSPLFEFAILYPKQKHGLRRFIDRTFARCEEFRRWFGNNSKKFL